MAIATSTNYYANAIVGQPMVGADINVLDRHTTPKYAVGFGFTRSDGNKYRYVHYGSAVVGNALVGCSNTNNNVYSVNAIVVAPATAQAVANEKITAGSAGSRYVEIILATVANNQYAGGYLSIVKDSGVGHTYRIRGNTATGTPTSGNFRCELYEPIKVALDNTSDIIIVANPYSDLDEAGVVAAGYSYVGVSQAAASADNWGWVCTHGVTGCLCSGTGVVGAPVFAQVSSGSVGISPGSLTLLTPANVLSQVGYMIAPAGAATQQAVIYVTIE